MRNRSALSKLKTLEKTFLSTVENKDKDRATQAAKDLISAFDKATKSNLVHSNKVARKKARFSKLIASL